MFAYCNNNSILFSDHSGRIPVSIIVIGALAVANNALLKYYYEHESDSKSDLQSDSYAKGETITWQDKLDYTRQQTGETEYNLNAWRYYNEYTFHQYGWYLTGWAYERDIPLVSWLSERFYSADVVVGSWDGRWYVDLGTIFTGILGL